MQSDSFDVFFQIDRQCVYCKQDAQETAEICQDGASIVVTMRNTPSPKLLCDLFLKNLYMCTPMEFCGFYCLYNWVKEHVERAARPSGY